MSLQVLVQTGNKNYTAKDALQLLKDLNLTQQVSTIQAVMIHQAWTISVNPSITSGCEFGFCR